MKKLLAVLAVLTMGIMLAACTTPTNKTLFGKELVAVEAQFDILTNMDNGSADIGVLDSIMAGYYMTSDNYKDKMELLPFYLSEEEYGIGAKKGNDALTSKINEALIALAGNGTIETIGNTFGLYSENLVKSSTVNPKASASDSSWNNVVAAKKLIIGYTVFAPIAFTDNNQKFTGYDIELAKAVVEYLNTTYSAEITLEFIEIEWSQKEALLENGTIDLVWNGMTITDSRIEGMSMSIPYLANKQSIIIMKADKANYDISNLEAFKKSAKDAIVYVESGSAAEDVMKQN